MDLDYSNLFSNFHGDTEQLAQLIPIIEECQPLLTAEGMEVMQALLAERGISTIQAIVVTRAVLGWDTTPLRVAIDTVCESAARQRR